MEGQNDRDRLNPISEYFEHWAKLGLGELSSPDIIAWISRTKLFESITKVAQQELSELYERCRDPYRELWELGAQQRQMQRSDDPVVVIETSGPGWERSERLYIRDWLTLGHASEHFPSAKQLVDVIEDWCSAHHLPIDDPKSMLWLCICRWFTSATKPDPLVVVWMGVLSVSDGERKAMGAGLADTSLSRSKNIVGEAACSPPPAPTYEPLAMTRIEYLKKIGEIYKEYCAKLEIAFLEKGFVRTRQKRNRGDSQWEHAEWFVRYQIQLQSPAEIAKQYRDANIDESTIHDAVEKFSSDARIPLREKINVVPQSKKRKARSEKR